MVHFVLKTPAISSRRLRYRSFSSASTSKAVKTLSFIYQYPPTQEELQAQRASSKSSAPWFDDLGKILDQAQRDVAGAEEPTKIETPLEPAWMAELRKIALREVEEDKGENGGQSKAMNATTTGERTAINDPSLKITPQQAMISETAQEPAMAPEIAQEQATSPETAQERTMATDKLEVVDLHRAERILDESSITSAPAQISVASLAAPVEISTELVTQVESDVMMPSRSACDYSRVPNA